MVHARRTELLRLTEASVAVALSVLLGNVRLLELPNGGSIALATLPLLAVAVSRGVRTGMAAGACAGIAHALSGGTIIHPVQLGLDYFVAYAALGLAGLAAGRGTSRAPLAPALLLAMAVHLAAMVVSGVVFFAPTAGSAALGYSLVYNAATVLPEAALALWLVPPLTRALARANPADAWRRGLLRPPPSTPRIPRTIHAPTPIDTEPPMPDTLRPVPNLTRSRTDIRPVPSASSMPPQRGRIARSAPFPSPSFRPLRLTSAAAPQVPTRG